MSLYLPLTTDKETIGLFYSLIKSNGMLREFFFAAFVNLLKFFKGEEWWFFLFFFLRAELVLTHGRLRTCFSGSNLWSLEICKRCKSLLMWGRWRTWLHTLDLSVEGVSNFAEVFQKQVNKHVPLHLVQSKQFVLIYTEWRFNFAHNVHELK